MADADRFRLNDLIFSQDSATEYDEMEDFLKPSSSKRLKMSLRLGSVQPKPDIAPLPKGKLQELFFTWLCQPSSSEIIRGLISDLHSQKEVQMPGRSSIPQDSRTQIGAPKSPVSHLIRVNATFPPSPVPRSGRSREDLLHAGRLSPLGFLDKDHESSFVDSSLRNLSSLRSNLSRRTSFSSTATEAHAEKPSIARFYFAEGRISPYEHDEIELADVRAAVLRKAEQNGIRGVSKQVLSSIMVRSLGLPSFLTTCVFDRILELSPEEKGTLNVNGSKEGHTGAVASLGAFMKFYKELCLGKSNPARLFYLLKHRRVENYLCRESLRPLMEGLLECHPGLVFLSNTPEFQVRYSETVIERIFYSCARHNTRCLYLGDIEKSRLLDSLLWLDQEEDINVERKYFSYKHFYVLYCRFWELDTDHDLSIGLEDLMRYGNGALTVRIAERILGGFGRENDSPVKYRMSYTDFVWFCISEEDKKSPRALDFWFRCIDLDGDGLITLADIEYFYREQYSRMEDRGHEPVPFVNIVCQLLDMLQHPEERKPFISKKDLRACNMQSVFFNYLFNLGKFFQIESRDPRLIQQERAFPDYTDWDRFAAFEYERLTANEEEIMGAGADPVMSQLDM
uniref:EF-hand domain-containing protein n=1 Tax=Rhodosorus marinus TaxID=101924 RepID=A0A7S0BML4_9RHOD|mmetsp:Transcript_23714/g.34092  ORF Transcript_23714/g.34092 Transcript_23714/m.34092 type:complete len:624 (+) Transcript_23714:471-2342(+)